jgi:hypothetical protein
MYPEKSAKAQSRCSVSSRRSAFFPPGLDPVLDRRPGDEDTVVSPEAPTGGLIRQAVLDDQADRRGDDPSGVVTARRGQVGGVRVEVLAAHCAIVLRVAQDEVARTTGDEIAQVVESASKDFVSVGTVAASGTEPSPVVAATLADLELREILDARDALGGVRQVFSGSWHGAVLL